MFSALHEIARAISYPGFRVLVMPVIMAFAE